LLVCPINLFEIRPLLMPNRGANGVKV
jgi:hypothetical protein